MERIAQEFEDLEFDSTKVFHFGHVAVNGFDEVFKKIKISQFIMRDQMQQPGITLQIISQIDLPVQYFIEIVDCLSEFTGSEIEGGYFIIKYENTMAIQIQ